nr:hypothetical protein [Candidatus Freyarchaeota archaeon]
MMLNSQSRVFPLHHYPHLTCVKAPKRFELSSTDWRPVMLVFNTKDALVTIIHSICFS